MRALFLGQKPIGEAAWRLLRDSAGRGIDVVALCSNRDPRRVWWKSNAIYRTRGSAVFVDNAERNSEQLSDVIDELGVELVLCVHHPWILPPSLLRRVGHNALTLHNAKLPQYRGFNAVNHAILNGDTTFTCTAHWMADEVDTGPIALESTFPIAPDETALSLYAKAHHAALVLFAEILRRLLAGEQLPRRPLEGTGRFYARSSIEELREIRDPAGPELELKARAFHFPPFEPAFFSRDGSKVYAVPEGGLTGRDDPRALLDLTVEQTRDVELSVE